jgi:hypothetical protein
VRGGVHCGIYKNFYNVSLLNSPPPLFSFVPPSPLPGRVSTGLIFSNYKHVHTVSALYSPSYTFPHLLPPPMGTKPPGRTCSAFLFPNFVKERQKWHFCLFKISKTLVFLWHFYLYVYYSLIWFISIFLSNLMILALCYYIMAFLSLVTVFDLESTFSDISIANPAIL